MKNTQKQKKGFSCAKLRNAKLFLPRPVGGADLTRPNLLWVQFNNMKDPFGVLFRA